MALSAANLGAAFAHAGADERSLMVDDRLLISEWTAAAQPAPVFQARARQPMPALREPPVGAHAAAAAPAEPRARTAPPGQGRTGRLLQASLALLVALAMHHAFASAIDVAVLARAPRMTFEAELALRALYPAGALLLLLLLPAVL